MFKQRHLTYINTAPTLSANSQPPMSLCSMNPTSTVSKTESFTDFISDNITETWLSANDEAARASITPCGYKLTDCPRVKRTGGGTALLFAQSIDTKFIDSGET